MCVNVEGLWFEGRRRSRMCRGCSLSTSRLWLTMARTWWTRPSAQSSRPSESQPWGARLRGYGGKEGKMVISQKTELGWEFGRLRLNQRGQPPHHPSPTGPVDRWAAGAGLWILSLGCAFCLLEGLPLLLGALLCQHGPGARVWGLGSHLPPSPRPLPVPRVPHIDLEPLTYRRLTWRRHRSS